MKALTISTFGLVMLLALTPVLQTGCQTMSKEERQAKRAAKKKSKKGNKARSGPDLTPVVPQRDSYGRVNTSLPFLAITFDDGPHPTNTPRLLDILKAHDVKATFFVVGTNARRYPQILRRMIAEGHEIGNHTLDHAKLTNLSPAAVEKELGVTHQTILDATGVAPRLMRPPYGAITASQKSWIKKKFGYPSILWSVDPEDWKRPGVSVVTSRLVSGARPGGILLAHDIHKPTIDAIPAVLQQLKQRGFQFVTVSQLIALDGKG